MAPVFMPREVELSQRSSSRRQNPPVSACSLEQMKQLAWILWCAFSAQLPEAWGWNRVVHSHQPHFSSP